MGNVENSGEVARAEVGKVVNSGALDGAVVGNVVNSGEVEGCVAGRVVNSRAIGVDGDCAVACNVLIWSLLGVLVSCAGKVVKVPIKARGCAHLCCCGVLASSLSSSVYAGSVNWLLCSVLLVGASVGSTFSLTMNFAEHAYGAITYFSSAYTHTRISSIHIASCHSQGLSTLDGIHWMSKLVIITA